MKVTKTQNGFLLQIRDQEFLLDDIEFAAFCRAGNLYKHLAKGPFEPPFVLHVAIPYDDVDQEQTTTHYNLVIGFPSMTLLRAGQVLILEEMKRLPKALADAIEIAVPAVPEDQFFGFSEVASPEDALREFREVLAEHFEYQVGEAYMETITALSPVSTD